MDVQPDLVEVIADLRTTVEGVLSETKKWEETFKSGLLEVQKWEGSFIILETQLKLLQEQVSKYSRRILDNERDIARVEENLTEVAMSMTPIPKPK